MATVQRIVARTSNRLFVGLPLCSCSSSHPWWLSYHTRQRSWIRTPPHQLHYQRCSFGQTPPFSTRTYQTVRIYFVILHKTDECIDFSCIWHLFLGKLTRPLDYLDPWSKKDWRLTESVARTGKEDRYVSPLICYLNYTEHLQEWPSFMVAGWSPSGV